MRQADQLQAGAARALIARTAKFIASVAPTDAFVDIKQSDTEESGGHRAWVISDAYGAQSLPSSVGLLTDAAPMMAILLQTRDQSWAQQRAGAVHPQQEFP